MMFWRKNRRGFRRFSTEWEGILEVRFRDEEGALAATVVNLSGLGARIHAERVHVHRRHLIDRSLSAELWLNVETPEGPLRSRVDIQWYRWLVEKSVFEIGIVFLEMAPSHRLMLERILDGLQGRRRGSGAHGNRVKGARTFGIFRTAKSA